MSLTEQAAEQRRLSRTVVPDGWVPIPSGGSQARMALDCYAQVVPAQGMANRHYWIVYDGANNPVASGYGNTDHEGRMAAVEAMRAIAVGQP